MVCALSLRSCTFKTSVLILVILVLFAFECKELYGKIKKEHRFAYYNEYVSFQRQLMAEAKVFLYRRLRSTVQPTGLNEWTIRRTFTYYG